MTKDTDKFSHKNPSKRKNGGEERDYSFFAIREQQQARRNAFTQARRHFNESELERARTLDKKSVLRPAIKSVESGCSPQTIELPLDKILKSRHAPIRDDFYNIQKKGEHRQAGENAYNVSIAYRYSSDQEFTNYLSLASEFGGKRLRFTDEKIVECGIFATKYIAYQSSSKMRDREAVCDSLNGIISERMEEIQTSLRGLSTENISQPLDSATLKQQFSFLQIPEESEPMQEKRRSVGEQLHQAYNTLFRKMLTCNVLPDTDQGSANYDKDKYLHDVVHYSLEGHQINLLNERDWHKYNNLVKKLDGLNQAIDAFEVTRTYIATSSMTSRSIQSFLTENNVSFPGFIPAENALIDIIQSKEPGGIFIDTAAALKELRSIVFPDSGVYYLHTQMVDDLKEVVVLGSKGRISKEAFLLKECIPAIVETIQKKEIDIAKEVKKEKGNEEEKVKPGNVRSHVEEIKINRLNPSGPSVI